MCETAAEMMRRDAPDLVVLDARSRSEVDWDRLSGYARSLHIFTV